MLINQLYLYFSRTYKPLKCPNMVISTVRSTVHLVNEYHAPPSNASYIRDYCEVC